MAYDFTTNGYLVLAPWTAALARVYQGVDDHRWPLQDTQSFTALRAQLGIPNALEGVEAATLWPQTYEYWSRCRATGLDARILLIDTKYRFPAVSAPEDVWQTLGYDVAEPRGCHSVLRHEVIVGTSPALQRWRERLNEAGLLPDLTACEAFMRERAALQTRDPSAVYSAPGFHFVPVFVRRFVSE